MVAAADSAPADKAVADLVCDGGRDDTVTLRAASVLLRMRGGDRIQLAGGHYDLVVWRRVPRKVKKRIRRLALSASR